MLTQATITRKIVEEEIGSKAISKKNPYTSVKESHLPKKIVQCSYLLLLFYNPEQNKVKQKGSFEVKYK